MSPDARSTYFIDPPAESAWTRAACAVVALAVALAFGVAAFTYWVPAHQGVDQNGYLVGGSQFYDHLTMRLVPTRPDGRKTPQFDPLGFVGRMWVGFDMESAGRDDGEPRFYPKYPLGLPLIYAGALAVGDGLRGTLGLTSPDWPYAAVYAVSPLAMTLAVAGVFPLVRRFAGSVWGLVGMIAFACAPVTTQLTTNPNSHATAVACVVWGFVLLLGWWAGGETARGSGRAWGFFGGLLIGYAATIRYTEVLLVLPLLWAVSQNLRWRRPWVVGTLVVAAGVAVAGLRVAPDLGGAWGTTAAILISLAAAWAVATSAQSPSAVSPDDDGRHLASAGLVVLGWALPVGLLVAYNLAAMGSVTGYDPTNESAGFAWAFFFDNWRTVLDGLTNNGLFLLLPLSVAGLVGLLWREWRAGVFVLLWVGPTTVVYAFYYWAPAASIGYLRFFLTAVPGFVVAAFWAVSWGRAQVARLVAEGRATPTPEPAGRRAGRLISAGAVIAASAVVAVGLAFAVRYDADAGGGAGGVTPLSEFLGGGFDVTSFAASLVAAGAAAGASLATFGPGWVDRFARARALRTFHYAACPTAPRLVTLVAGALTAASAAAGLAGSLPDIERDAARRLYLRDLGDRVRAVVPAGSVVFADSTDVLQYLQFVGDYSLYPVEAFDAGWLGRQRSPRDWRDRDRLAPDPNDPQPDDAGRREMVVRLLGNADGAALLKRQRDLVRDARAAGHRSYFVLPLRNREYGEFRQARRKGEPYLPGEARRVVGDSDLTADVADAWDVYPTPRPDVGGTVSFRGNRQSWGRRLSGDGAWAVVEVRPK